MLTNARVLGHVFNPLTVYWCHHPDGTLACVVAEVHNTYGERHCYLLRTDAAGRARTAKEFYVSPFFDRRRRVPHAPSRPRRAAGPHDHVAAERVQGVRRHTRRSAQARDPPLPRGHGGPPPARDAPHVGPRSAGTASRCGCAACPSSPDRAMHRRKASNDHVPRREAIEQPLRASAGRGCLARPRHPTPIRHSRTHRRGALPPRGAHTARAGRVRRRGTDRSRRPGLPGDADRAARRRSSTGSAATPRSASASRTWSATGRPTDLADLLTPFAARLADARPRDAAAHRAASPRHASRGEERNTVEGSRREHPAPLRPVQRPVRAVPRRDHDATRRRGSPTRTTPLADAQRRKIDGILDLARRRPGHAACSRSAPAGVAGHPRGAARARG